MLSGKTLALESIILVDVFVVVVVVDAEETLAVKQSRNWINLVRLFYLKETQSYPLLRRVTSVISPSPSHFNTNHPPKEAFVIIIMKRHQSQHYQRYHHCHPCQLPLHCCFLSLSPLSPPHLKTGTTRAEAVQEADHHRHPRYAHTLVVRTF